MIKPYSESCEQNKDPILQVIQPLLSKHNQLLEIGSGTGQHAIYFAQAMPHLQWQTSDRDSLLAGIQLWLNEHKEIHNLKPPIALDVMQAHWPDLEVDAIFTDNTIHIMSLPQVEMFFTKATYLLQNNGIFLAYGPFNYQGHYTSESNQQFDRWLKSRDSQSGIKDFEIINEWAEKNDLQLQADYEMPANNRLLYWQKIVSS